MPAKREGWFSAAKDACGLTARNGRPPCRLILLGPPGVGKGTQAQLLSQRLRACHLSTGDLFRAADRENASPAMQEALEVMKRGELVSDEMVIATVRERSGCLNCQGGFLLDGFPRTVEQAQALDAMLSELKVKLDGAIFYQLPIEEIVARLSGRRTCDSCQAVFNLAAKPPQHPGQCDLCNGRLSQRRDDQPESIRVRMKAYQELIEPLLAHYEHVGLLHRVAANGSPEEILARSLAAISPLGVA